jgi:hypothetical protein
MSEPVKTSASDNGRVANTGADLPGGSPQTPRVITDPREIAAVVMTQVHVVNSKRDELLTAIKGLTDMTQQLVIAYAGQARLLERLANRGKPPEEKSTGNNGTSQMAA